jgi:uroporphyrinogen-III synthase
MRVIVTRPEQQALAWAAQLRHGLPHDVEVIALPLIDIAAPAQTAPVAQAWAELADARLVVFVSPSAAQWFFALRPAEKAAKASANCATDYATNWPATTQAAAPGPGTGAALIELGVPAAQVLAPAADAAQFDSETLWARLGGLDGDWRGARVLMVCGGDDEQARGRPWLTQQLQARGAMVRTVVTYQRRAPRFDATQLAQCEAALREPGRHVWLFSSSEAIAHLIELQRAHGWPAPGAASIALATHPRIAETAQAAGFGQVGRTRPALSDVVAALQTQASGLAGSGPVDTIVPP